MIDIARRKLTEIIARYGRSICNDPQRCEGLLRDMCGDQRRAIHVLVGAMKGGAPADLLSAAPGVPPSVVMGRLTRRLEEDQAMTREAASWAVETWALALGVISAADLAPASAGVEGRVGAGGRRLADAAGRVAGRGDAAIRGDAERVPDVGKASSGKPAPGWKKIVLVLPEELDRRLGAVASQARVSKSELIRQILSAALEEAA